MNKLKEKIEDTGLCLTQCIYYDEYSVGSLGCQGCDYYKNRNIEKRFVKCSYRYKHKRENDD